MNIAIFLFFNLNGDHASMKTLAVLCSMLASPFASCAMPFPSDFQWGASSAAYQIEGATDADGKGKSVWDYYLNDKKIAGPDVNGNTAINFYDRKQYLKDIALFKELGLNSYRFSISWSRILPEGTGRINEKGIQHYRQFIQDLKAAGIKPLITLYHWDMPLALAAKGGWLNRDAITWYTEYAKVIFDNFHDQADHFVLVNEPTVEVAQNTLAAEKLAGKDVGSYPPLIPRKDDLGNALKSFNHILLASAAAQDLFRKSGYAGSLGIAVPLFPVLTEDNASAADKKDAEMTDGIMNRWFLDSIYKGQYPAHVLNYLAENNIDADIHPEDAKTIQQANFGFMGVNYYAPLYIRHNPEGDSGYAPEFYNPKDQKNAFTGPVRPDQLERLLSNLRTDYGNPAVIITENGAAFKDEDVKVNGKINDTNRCLYIRDHISAVEKALEQGSKVKGYYVWSSHDNLEWMSGYKTRFGLIYVDYSNQKRTPKLSAEIYSRLIKGEKIKDSDCYRS